MTNLDCILKSRDITLPTKVYIVKVKVKVAQSCLTFCNPMVCTVHGFLQARILEWVAFPFSRESFPWRSNPGLPHSRHILYQLSQEGSPCIVKGMVLLVVLYGCEIWTIKEAECQRTGAFELWCWRRLLRVPWTARRWSQSILKEINPEYSLEGLMVKLNILATWYEELTDLKRPWCWKRLKAGGKGDDRGWDGWMASPTQWTLVWVNSGIGDGQGGLACCGWWGCKESDMVKWLNWLNWREEGDEKGWNGWMTSPIQWRWVWASSVRWWRRGKPGVLQSMGSQIVGHDWVTEWQQQY